MPRTVSRWLGSVGLWILLLFPPPPIWAQRSELDRLLELLVKKNLVTQEEAESLRDELARDRVSQQAQTLIEKQAQTGQAKEQPVTANRQVRLSGWAQTRFTSTAGTKNSIELRRARLAVGGNLTDSISYRMQADFVRSPVLLDAHIDFTRLPFAKLRIGQFKVPFSQENLISSKDLLTIERALPVLNLVPGRDTSNNGRDIGLQVEGNIVRGDGRPLFDYTVGLFDGAGINRRDDNHRKDAAIRVVTHLARGFWIGGEYYNGYIGTTQAEKERAAAEFFLLRGSFTVQGEYIWGRDGATHKRGSYTMVAYRFRPRWEGIFRFEELEPNKSALRDDTRAYLVGFNWYFNDWVKFQLNYSANDEAARQRLNHTMLTQFQFQF